MKDRLGDVGVVRLRLRGYPEALHRTAEFVLGAERFADACGYARGAPCVAEIGAYYRGITTRDGYGIYI